MAHRDPRFSRFDVRPITGALGAEIHGVDLGREQDSTIFAEVRRVLDEHHVVAVRDQKLTAQSLHVVARKFGPFSGNPVHQPMEGFDDIVKFIREPDDTGKVIGEEWHMDLAWMEKPPGITMLYGDVIPPVGGDTCFASLEQLYRALTPRMIEMLRGFTGIYSGKGVFAINAQHSRLGLKMDAPATDDIEVEHPVICTHPATGRPYVFAASVLRRFKGMSEGESKPIIDFLMATATRPEFCCRVRWEQGTLTMWDNPVVLHTAINDYSGYRRVTYRTTVEGWVPVAAPASAASHRAA
jgi:alpha-ketoglutarate-dependent taurine dioxygenase